MVVIAVGENSFYGRAMAVSTNNLLYPSNHLMALITATSRCTNRTHAITTQVERIGRPNCKIRVRSSWLDVWVWQCDALFMLSPPPPPLMHVLSLPHPSYSVLLVKLLVLSILQDHWLSTRELLTELVGIVIQAITVIVVAVSRWMPVAMTTGWLIMVVVDFRYLKDCLWQWPLLWHSQQRKC